MNNPDNNDRTETRLAIFASGTGSNTQKIIDYFRNDDTIHIALIVCNKPGAGVLDIAERENIPALIIERGKFIAEGYVPALVEKKIGWIILAGFLWKVPISLIQAFHNRIINIHPALLPKYGGKGMYGHFVHEAVLAAGEKESGITIHYVDEHFDHGAPILQVKCPVEANDTPDSLAQKIHTLEHRYYPATIRDLISKGA